MDSSGQRTAANSGREMFGRGVVSYTSRMVFDRSMPSDSVLWIVASGLRRFDITNGVVTTVPINLDWIVTLCCIPTGTQILANDSAIYSFDPRTNTLNKLAGAGTEEARGFADGSGEQARIDAPRGGGSGCGAVRLHRRS